MVHSTGSSSSNSRTGGGLRTLCEVVDWTAVFLIIVLGIGTGIVGKRTPVFRPIYVGDATIAYPHYDTNSVAFWVAIVVPAVVLLVAAAVLEFWTFRFRQSRQQAAVLYVNIVLTMLAALAVTGFLTELFKRICGRLRWAVCVGG